MITIIHTYINMFTFQYSETKKRGELEDLFSVLDEVCFENRMSKLQEYSKVHIALQPRDLAIKPQLISHHQLNDTMLELFNKEVGSVQILTRI